MDLFCGTGTIGLALAARCREVVGVDISAAAVLDAGRNAERNGAANARFVLGDLDALAGKLGQNLPQPDVVIVGV